MERRKSGGRNFQSQETSLRLEFAFEADWLLLLLFTNIRLESSQSSF